MTTTTTIGDVARMAGVTVRTLHHYDEIALLVPSERRQNGYRGYSDDDIARLQQILAYRELGLGLDEISAILDDPAGTTGRLVDARRRIERHMDRLRGIISNLEAAIAAEEEGTAMTPEQRLEAFGDFDPVQYDDEARQQWATTDTYEESMRRTSSYTPADWQRQRSEAADLDQRFLALMDAGVAADSEDAAELVDAHRNLISRWFYECTPEIHAGLGTMYVADPRFMQNIDTAGAGLAAYLSAAIRVRYGS
ncbi:MAG: MerR family transcriptional regulator [Actinomycetia bacterium]|nr:MerR family transcriptional regulator [Actinomycetes bacterium]